MIIYLLSLSSVYYWHFSSFLILYLRFLLKWAARIVFSHWIKFNYSQNLSIYLAINIFYYRYRAIYFKIFSLCNIINICQILILKFVNRESIYLRLLILL